jgi:5-methylcytosine-specific restriction endonuclease McrA
MNIIPATEKRCTGCQEVKPRTDFHRAGNSVTPKCKACVSAYAREHYLELKARPIDVPNERTCPLCDVTKPVSEFYPNAARGVSVWCRTCCSVKRKARHAKDRERVNAQVREYYWRVKDERYKRIQARRAADPERFKSYFATYKTKHPERVREQGRVAAKIRRDRKKGAEGSYTTAEWVSLKARYSYRCLCCGEREPDIKLTVDHVQPISKGGSNTIDNIQPLCGSCNARKNARHIDYRTPHQFGLTACSVAGHRPIVSPLLQMQPARLTADSFISATRRERMCHARW